MEEVQKENQTKNFSHPNLQWKIALFTDKPNQEARKETIEADINEETIEADADALIKDVNIFFLFVELHIYSGMIHKTSPLEDDTSTDNDDLYNASTDNNNGYKIEILEDGTSTDKLDGYKIEMLDLMLIHLNDPN